MQNILITGGLGYIGSKITSLYFNDPNNNVTVIDNHINLKTITQLKSNGVEFENLDILDRKKLSPLVKKADTIFHLAGVTSVPRTKNQESDKLNKQIFETATLGTRNILEEMKDSTKIIFPSTHVVFEGLKDIKFDIDEEYETSPVLVYAKSKLQNEIDISKYCSNFIILRLGSVHGLNTITTRYNIMVNLFAQIAANNGSINLHGGGIQLKSLVSIDDVTLCFKYFAENHKISNEIFHCVSENMTVKEVAELCKKYCKNIEINITDEEIPNHGYALSNKKLLNAGFKFKNTVEDSIIDIIHNERLSNDK